LAVRALRLKGANVIDQAVDDGGISQPSAFENVQGRRIVEIRGGLPRPRHIVEKLQNCRARRANLANMRPEYLPPIVINRLKLWIIDLEKRNIAQIPGRVGAEVLCRKFFPRKVGLSLDAESKTDQAQPQP
jgi:hypothetical protein